MGKETTLYLASLNPGKLRELAALAEAEGFRLEAVPDIERLPAAQEEDPSFTLNALEKALHYSRFTPGVVVADDSGLAVDALGGRPGVHSARYAGPAASDADNNRRLLEELRPVPEPQRTARYICVLVVAHQQSVQAVFSDYCEGQILAEPRGSGGFGYDPLFFFPSLEKTFAEASPAEKNLHSHRGKAFRKLLVYFRSRREPVEPAC